MWRMRSHFTLLSRTLETYSRTIIRVEIDAAGRETGEAVRQFDVVFARKIAHERPELFACNNFLSLSRNTL